MAKKNTIILFILFLMLASFTLFLKCFFPLKQGFDGSAKVYEELPVVGKYSPSAKYNRVILLVIDAMRRDFVLGDHTFNMPYLTKLLKNGNGMVFTAKAHPPTVTLPRIKALTTGNIPGFIDVVLNFGSSSLDEDNVITQMKEAGKHLVFYGDDTWLKLFPEHFIRFDGTTSFFVTDTTEVDVNVTRHLPEELTLYDWNMMILHYLGLDHIGHLAGPQSPLVPPKLLEMDSVIQKLYKGMRQWHSDDQFNTLMVICGDHGMSDQGGHGGATPGETNVPMIFLSPSFNHENTENYAEETILQIDAAPTLSLVMGIPIPKNNLGEVVTPLLIGYSLEEKVKLKLTNAYQVSHLLRQNVADVEKENGYYLYEQVLKRHSEWLKMKDTNISSETWEVIGHRLVEDYGKAIREMRSRVLETSTQYDLYGMSVGIILLWLVLVFLKAVKEADPYDLSLTMNRLAVCLVFCVPVILGHVTVCTSRYHSNLMCASSFLLVAVQGLTIVLIVTSTLYSLMILMKRKESLRKTKSFSGIEWAFICGSVLHTGSLLSSSFVEEEHQTWYFYITTLHLMFSWNLIGHVCFEKSCDTNNGTVWNTYNPTESGSVNNSNHPELLQKSRKSVSDKIIHRRLSLTVFLKSQAAIFVVLLLWRILRRWNQTGDKWLNIPDIGDWLVRPDNKFYLSASIVVSMVTLLFVRMRSSFCQIILGIVAMTTTYFFRASNGVVFLPNVYAAASQGTLEARLTYCVLLLFLLSSVWEFRRADSEQRLSSFWNNVQTAWLLLMMLLLRPHNAPLVTMMSVIEYFVCRHILPVVKLRPVFLCMYCYWMGQASFFLQGNSNSLSSVDVSAGYIGLVDYCPLLIGLLMCVSTYAGPIFWMISLFKYIHIAELYPGSQHSTKILVHQHHMTAAMTLVLCRALPLAVYSVLVTVERYHLFVWTVFSPKLLFEGMNSVVLSVFIILHVASSSLYDTSKQGKHKL